MSTAISQAGAPAWVYGDVSAIDQAFAARGVGARVLPGGVLVAGRAFVVYRLQLAAGESVRRVGAMVPDLAESISSVRGAAAPVRLRSLPLALELPHIAPAGVSAAALPLTGLAPGRAALGRCYDWRGVSDLVLDLDRFPHVLIASRSGGGKSTLLRSLVLSLAAGTAPAALGVVLLDGKNENGAALGGLPHVTAAAWSGADMVALLRRVGLLLDQRIAGGAGPAAGRVVVVIDELLSLIDAGGGDLLARIMGLGRSLGVHVIAASQHITAAAVGSIVKANFAARLVGSVSSSAAALAAAGVGDTGAEKLAGRGAFLAVTGDRVIRFQAYNVTAAAAEEIAGQIAPRWRGDLPPALPDLPAQPMSTIQAGTAPALLSSGCGVVAVDEIGRVADRLAPHVAEFQAGALSLAALIRLVYGDVSTGGGYRRRVLAALARLGVLAPAQPMSTIPAPDLDTL